MIGSDLLPHIAATSRSDKHSLNLWRWVRKHRKHNLFVAVKTKDGDVYDPSKTQVSILYIGISDLDEGWLHGARLSEVLCNGTKTDEWAFQPGCKFVAIPDWWDGYVAGGKCFIDPEHKLYYDRERWETSADGKSRKCLWCGNHEQHIHTYKVERTEWRDYPAETAP